MERMTPGGLIIPVDVAGERTPSLHCLICGATYMDDEQAAWQAHVAQCARNHEPEIHEASPRTQLPVFNDPAQWDVEYERWVKANPEAWKRERGIRDEG